MNFKLLPIMMVGLLSFKPMTINDPNGDNNGNGNGKKVTVVTKSSTIKSKEIAAVTKTNLKSTTSNLSAFDKLVLSEYLDLDEKKFDKPEMESFKAAFKGYYKLKEEGKLNKDLLTIIDFTKSSTERRMWVIDMKSNEILY